VTMRVRVGLSTACALVLLAALLPRPEPARAATFTVTTTADAPHTAPLDGNCTSTLPGNPCTLRATVQAVNFLDGGPHTINLGVPGTYALTVTDAGEDNAATGDLDINKVTVTITNASTGMVAIDSNGTDRLFDISPVAPARVILTQLAIQNGLAGTVAMQTLYTSPAASHGAQLEELPGRDTLTCEIIKTLGMNSQEIVTNALADMGYAPNTPESQWVIQHSDRIAANLVTFFNTLQATPVTHDDLSEATRRVIRSMLLTQVGTQLSEESPDGQAQRLIRWCTTGQTG
jgi:hypothetical protein